MLAIDTSHRPLLGINQSPPKSINEMIDDSFKTKFFEYSNLNEFYDNKPAREEVFKPNFVFDELKNIRF